MFVAQKIAEAYLATIRWSQTVHSAHVDEDLASLLTEMSKMTEDIIAKLENYGPDTLKTIEQNLGYSGPSKKINLTLEINLSNLEKCNEALQRLEENL